MEFIQFTQEEKKIKSESVKHGFKVIESFCGAGGLSYGLETTGFDVVLAFDNDVKSVETHKRNLQVNVLVKKGCLRNIQNLP